MTAIERALENAISLYEPFRALSTGIGNTPRGIQTSEAFFVACMVGSHRPRQLVESGRALGKSTELFARWFPEIPILSVERDRDHPHAHRALERLRDRPNVSCLFGDAEVLLPEVVLPGDVVVIDGPKGLRALRLAMEVIERAHPSFVFIHDCPRGSSLRRFLDHHHPWVGCSDDPRWVRASCTLDHYLDPDLLSRCSGSRSLPSDRSYAGTFACLPDRAGFPTRRDFLSLRLARAMEALGRRAPGPRPLVAVATRPTNESTLAV